MDLKQIAEKRQAERNKHQIYKVVEDPKKPKFYILDMFPYPSGAGLHVGHPKGYIATDVIARKKTLQGFNVLHPMGFDTFGLGTEQYAIEKKMKPQIIAQQNIDNFKRQLKMFGLTYDRDRSFSTAEPDYYRWTQRIFLQLYNHYYDEKERKAKKVTDSEKQERLAYVDYKPINRCPKCMTGLANEDLADGKCERCGTIVEQKPMKQRVLRITKYAERLLEGLDKLQRDEAMKDLERNRIGKSEGTQFRMDIASDSVIASNAKQSKSLKVLILHGFNGDCVENRFPRIKKELESQGIETLIPNLPRTNKPQLKEQLQFLEDNYRDLIDENTIIIGHSLGCFLANEFIIKCNKKIKKLINIAPVHEELTIDHNDVNSYFQGIKIDTKKLGKLVDEHIVFISKDDELIPYEEAKKYYEKAFKDVKIISFEDKGHFNKKRGDVCELPEIMKYINSSSLDPRPSTLSFEVYTTRIDTVYGMSFVVMAPEHELVDQITTKEHKKAVEKYKDEAKHKTQLERTELQKDKSGQFTGAYAINPFNNQKVPIFIADYVLAGYGTGVVMAVPAHDERDFEFAKKYKLPITQSIAPYHIDNTEVSTPRKDKETKERNTISVVIKHRKEDKYYVLDREKFGRKSFIIGGVETGETLEEAVIRETKEETGYQNFTIERKLGFECSEHYYAAHKEVNHLAHVNFFFVQLKDDTFIQPQEEHIKNHKGLRVDAKEVEKRTDFPTHKYAREIYTKGECAYHDKGILVDSADFTGMESDKAITEMQKRLEKNKIGGKQTNFKMQDRVFSRQRYRGEPFPIARTESTPPKVLIIHGFEGDKEGNRFPRIKEELTKKGFQVLLETLPNPANPDFKESMKFLKPYFDQLGENDVLIGHSLGGKFALKLLEQSKKKIGTTILVAPVTNMPRDRAEKAKDPDMQNSDIEALKTIWELPLDGKKVDKSGIKKILLLSKDDPCIDINTAKSLSNERETIIFDKKSHFQYKEDTDILNIILKNTSSEGGSKAIALDEKELPILLPDVENYEPTGTTEGPLANIDERVNITLPDGSKAKRETNTMPGRAGSSRYRLRYMDPKNTKQLVSPEREKYRGEVDVYVGGAEHVTRHMIYARFWQKFLYDLGIVTHDEPFKEYHYVGLIMAEDGRKMSKRRGNTIDPDKVIGEFGHDTFRVYEMFMGPFDQAIARSTNGVKGAKKFLDKIIALQAKLPVETLHATSLAMTNETKTLLHQTIKKITDDIDGFKFNTCISQLMILVNHLTELPTIDKKTFETLTILISPFAPHLAEEVRSQLGNEFSIFTKATRPIYDEKCLACCDIKIGVQFNGKVRGDICVTKDTTQEQVMDLVKADAKLNARLTSEPKKIIYVPGKILNIVL